MIAKMLLSITLFAVTLLAVNVVHFRMFPVNVVLYSALLDAVIAVVIAGAASWYIIFRKDIPPIAFAQLLVIFALSGYIFSISVPTIIDRSFSMYILEKLQQQGSLKKSAFDDGAIVQEFNREGRLSDVRLTEQLQSGTITISNNCVTLTGRGQMIASITSWYRHTLLPQHRLLMGTYSDALTNPFREPSRMDAYRCE